MEIRNGHKRPDGIITGTYGTSKKGSNTYAGVLHDVVQKLRKQFNLAVRTPQQKPEVIRIRPVSTSAQFRSGPYGTAIAVLDIVGELHFRRFRQAGSRDRIQIGGAYANWLYLPPEVEAYYRASSGFADQLVIVQADLILG